MDCKKVNELLTKYLEEDLNPRDKCAVEKHLRDCRQCEGELALLKQILETAKNEKIPLPSEEYWASYTARLWQKLEGKAPTAEPSKSLWGRPLKWAIPAFALALILMVFSRSFYKQENPVPTAKTPAFQSGPTAQLPQAETEKATITVSQQPTLIKLAESIYEFYNPAVETIEVLDNLYVQATDIENVLEEKEEKDYLSSIDKLTNEEKHRLINKIRRLQT